MLQNDDMCATITAVLARLTLVYRDPAWAILWNFGAKCITTTKNPSFFRNMTISTIITMEKDPVLPGRDSSESSREGCHKCHERKAPYKRLKYWIGTLLVHAFALLTTITLLNHFSNLSNTSARKYLSSPSKYCELNPLKKDTLVLTSVRQPR